MYNDCDIVFLSGLFPPESENEIINNSKISVEFAANSFQWKLVNGFILNNVKSFKIFNSLFVNSFPRGYKKFFIKTFDFKLPINDTIHKNVGFINLYYIRHFFKTMSLKPYIKKWAIEQNDNKILLGYTAFNPTLELFKYAKQINPEINTCLIVPDLPQMCLGKNKLYNLFLNRTSLKMNQYKSYIDSYVILTEQMKEQLNITNKYVLIEGIIDSNTISISNKKEKSDIFKKIMYSGTLNKNYGIINLIQAFGKIDKENYQLIICGTGDSKEIIEKFAKTDKRILYYGVCEQEKVLQLQKQATVLINPRQNDYEYTKYSFPSKNLEYLASGTPMIGYKLPGIADEYDQYISYVENNTIDALKDKMTEICEMPQEFLEDMGYRARQFVVSQKNEIVQANKILDMMEFLHERKKRKV